MPDLYAHTLNSFLLSVTLVMILKPVARDLQFVDRPDSRKRHVGEIPVCGGIAIFAAFVLTVTGFQGHYEVPWNWVVGLGTLMFVGMVDDRWQIAATLRLGFQFVAAVILVFATGSGPLLLGEFGTGHAIHLSGVTAAALSLLFVVGTANAVNMQDGLDGMAGASSALALLWIGLLAASTGDELVYPLALIMVAAILGFLVFNMRHPWRRSASIFLGDAGSLVLGAMLAVFILRLSSGADGLPFVALLWIVAVPVLDTLSLIVRRLMAGRSPLSADRWHLHHLLLDCGFSHSSTAMIVACATALCGALAFGAVVFDVPDLLVQLGLCLAALVHTVFVLTAERRGGRRPPGELRPAALPAGSPHQEQYAASKFRQAGNVVSEL